MCYTALQSVDRTDGTTSMISAATGHKPRSVEAQACRDLCLPYLEVALDYNAPLLTLAAMYVMNDDGDPFYATLKDGARVTPKGSPCDEAITTGCKAGSLPTTGKIVVGVVVSAVGAFIVGLGCYYVWLVTTSQTA